MNTVKSQKKWSGIIDSLVEENGAVDSDEEKVLFIAYFLCQKAGFTLSDAASIAPADSWDALAGMLDREPDAVREYLTGKKKGLYAFLSAHGPNGGVQKIRELRDIARSSTAELLFGRVRIFLKGNAIKPLFQLLAFAHLRPDGIWDGD